LVQSTCRCMCVSQTAAQFTCTPPLLATSRLGLGLSLCNLGFLAQQWPCAHLVM
jgi:hypothetical protein